MRSHQLTPEVIAMLEQGIAEEEQGRDFKALSEERDRKLIAAQRAIKGQ